MIGFEQFLKISNFGGLPPGRRRGAQEKIFFGDHVWDENLGKVTEFGYHTMPEPNVVLRVTLTRTPSTTFGSVWV